ncbi:hypothetical protein IE077_003485 [Cardiosporidium cionae]|uniref:C3H1-type domain-containing protein n=1 Tax=Cardiosporidium cionae TaxID=476202 RepID=A0ABQ7J843_9APIC|nr:hypothetical protein IE077_003485 [Cardiosporidium cionae]|eukprot:KAF8820164.1 hypothetical protein IE077_003485 [Cardiosporidium cionae]
MEYNSRSDDLERYYFLPYQPSDTSNCYIAENYANSPYHNFNNGQYPPYYGPYMWIPVVIQTCDTHPAEKPIVPSYPDNSSEAYVSNRTVSSLANYQSTVVPSSAYYSNSSCNELIPSNSFIYSENEGDAHSSPYTKSDSLTLNELESKLMKENYEDNSTLKSAYDSNVNYHSLRSIGLSNGGEAAACYNLDGCVCNHNLSKNNSESMNESLISRGRVNPTLSQNATTDVKVVRCEPNHTDDLNREYSEFSTSTKNKSKMVGNTREMGPPIHVIENGDHTPNSSHLSFGTKFHSKGTCNPCWFEWSRGCHMGVHCRFCHDTSHKPSGAFRVIPSGETLANSPVTPELILKGLGSKKQRNIRSAKKNSGNKIHSV